MSGQQLNTQVQFASAELDAFICVNVATDVGQRVPTMTAACGTVRAQNLVMCLASGKT